MALLRLRLMKSLLKSPVVSVSVNRWMSDNKVITLEVDPADVIDNFTSELIQRKLTKWDNLKIRKKMCDDSCNLIVSETVEVNVQRLTTEELDKLIANALDENNEVSVKYLISCCTEHLKCPSLVVIMSVLDNYSRNGDVEMIAKIKTLVETTDPQTFASNAGFNHYLAEATWVKGDVLRALEMFENVYRDNIYQRRKIRLILKYLILDLTSRSEAILVNMVNFSERILQEYHDFFPLTCVWQACFLSEWFNDQMLALDLLERNDGLCKAITANIPYVVSVSLRSHQTEAVYRLLEIFLKYKLKLQYSIVLMALFDYRFHQRDLRSCMEIIQWSVTNKVMLPSTLHERFLMLLLKRTSTPKKPPKYQFTF